MQVRQPRHAITAQSNRRPALGFAGRNRKDAAILADLEIARRQPAIRLVQMLDFIEVGHGSSLHSGSFCSDPESRGVARVKDDFPGFEHHARPSTPEAIGHVLEPRIRKDGDISLLARL